MTEPARVRNGQHALSGLRPIPETVLVWGVDTARLSTTWTVTESNIALKSGSPLGTITYTHNTTGRRVTVAVRWNFFRAELQCGVINSWLEATEHAEVERDARHRVAALVAAYADIGSGAAPSSDDMRKVAGITVGALQYGGVALGVDDRNS